MGARGETARRPGRPGADTAAPTGEESILRRGLEAFAELGYERASARELARRLGVSHNFINDRYGSKAAFWRAVVDSVMGGHLAPLPRKDPALDDAEQLRQIIADFHRGAVDKPLIGRIIVDEFSRDSERLDYLYRGLHRSRAALYGAQHRAARRLRPHGAHPDGCTVLRRHPSRGGAGGGTIDAATGQNAAPRSRTTHAHGRVVGGACGQRTAGDGTAPR